MTHFVVSEAGTLTATAEEIDERRQNKYDAKIHCINNPVNPTIVDVLKTQISTIMDNEDFDAAVKRDACERLATKISNAYLCTALIQEDDIPQVIDESRQPIYELYQLLKSK